LRMAIAIAESDRSLLGGGAAEATSQFFEVAGVHCTHAKLQEKAASLSVWADELEDVEMEARIQAYAMAVLETAVLSGEPIDGVSQDYVKGLVIGCISAGIAYGYGVPLFGSRESLYAKAAEMAIVSAVQELSTHVEMEPHDKTAVETFRERADNEMPNVRDFYRWCIDNRLVRNWGKDRFDGKVWEFMSIVDACRCGMHLLEADTPSGNSLVLDQVKTAAYALGMIWLALDTSVAVRKLLDDGLDPNIVYYHSDRGFLLKVLMLRCVLYDGTAEEVRMRMKEAGLIGDEPGWTKMLAELWSETPEQYISQEALRLKPGPLAETIYRPPAARKGLLRHVSSIVQREFECVYGKGRTNGGRENRRRK